MEVAFPITNADKYYPRDKYPAGTYTAYLVKKIDLSWTNEHIDDFALMFGKDALADDKADDKAPEAERAPAFATPPAGARPPESFAPLRTIPF